MRGLFSFLIAIPDDIKAEPVEEQALHALATFEERFRARYERSRAYPQTLTLEDGRQYAWREDESAHERMERLMPSPARWEEALRAATCCVANDIYIFAERPDDELERSAIMRADRTTILDDIAANVRPRHNGPVPRSAKQCNLDPAAWLRFSLNCLDRSVLKPFTTLKRVRVQDYRAFDLRTPNERTLTKAVLAFSIRF